MSYSFEPKYDVLIGGGGFGDVFGSSQNPKIAGKFLRKRRTCLSAQQEYKIHSDVFESFKKVSSRVSSFTVLKPIGFTNHSPKEGYACMYSMERVYSYHNQGYLIQLAFSDSVPLMLRDRIVGRDVNSPIVMNDPYGQNNPPRGYNLSLKKAKSYLRSKFSLEEVILNMGYLNAIVVDAGYNGSDVEYVLVKTASGPKVGLLDFGMMAKLSTDSPEEAAEAIFDVNDMDMPMPSPTNPKRYLTHLYGFCKMGMKLAQLRGSKKKKEFFLSIIKSYYVLAVNSFIDQCVLSVIMANMPKVDAYTLEMFHLKKIRSKFFRFDSSKTLIFEDFANEGELTAKNCNLDKFLRLGVKRVLKNVSISFYKKFLDVSDSLTQYLLHSK